VTKVVVEPSGKTDVIVTGTFVVERLSDDAGALVLTVAPAVGASDGASEFESSNAVVATNVVSEVAGGVSVVDAIGEVVVSVETGIELAPVVVVMPASVDTVCPLVCPSVWPGGSAEPELDGGGGGDWPGGRTTYLQSLSSRTDWAPSPPVIGVRVTWHVCVIVPT